MALILAGITIKHFKGLADITINNLGEVNAFFGKNNSGKSTVLHAIDMASLALQQNAWSQFQPKLEIKDLFADVGSFTTVLNYADGTQCTISATPDYAPQKRPEPSDTQKFRSTLISPAMTGSLLNRRHQTPESIMQQLSSKNMAISSLSLLHAVYFFGRRNEYGLSIDDYNDLIGQVRAFFPDITEVSTERTPKDIDTLIYTEFGRKIDILYSGSGLQHFVDVLVKITLTNAQVVLLDEPEYGLHPDLQRRFMEYIVKLATDKNVQVFIATHSPVILNYADKLAKFRVFNDGGARSVIFIPQEATETLLGDLGVRPSDLFGRDICLMVEGKDDVIFFNHIVNILYKDDWKGVSVGVLQYAGSAAEGIIPGDIDISNIVPAQKHTYWIRDRDAPVASIPGTNATQFKNALERSGVQCHVTEKRELEYYYPRAIVVHAQQGDEAKAGQAIKLLEGDQAEKFRDAAKARNLAVPSGKNLRKLLRAHFTSKDQVPPEFRTLIEGALFQWRDEMLG